MPNGITMRLDTSGLTRSLNALRATSKRIPAYLVNKSVLYIAQDAYNKMPRVPVSQMDSELQVQIIGLTEKGRLSRAKDPPVKMPFWTGEPLAVRITLAKMYSTSIFNIRTGQFWKQGKPNTHGRAAFWQEIIDRTNRMILARHSSGGYFETQAKAIAELFRPAISRNPVVSAAAQTGIEALPGGGNVTRRIGTIAGGVVASGTGDTATATFWLAATNPDTDGVPGKALFRIAQPIWQRAVLAESVSILARARNLYTGAAREAGIKVK
jgi:hypothetical protein